MVGSCAQQRRYKIGDVRICEPLFVDVESGYPFHEDRIVATFGTAGFPNTEWGPAEVPREVMRALLAAVGRDDIAGTL